MPSEPAAALRTFRLERGTDLAYRAAGEGRSPALVLLHGVPNSSRGFRDVIGPLSRHAFVVAPDLPGSGASEPLPEPTFKAFADCVEELLDHLGVTERVIYLHDFGAPVGFELALRAPHLVRGVVIQNANAHRTGQGPDWAQTLAYWSAPNAENEAAATAHLTLEGTRHQYVGGVPPEVAARIDPANWLEDWRVMNLPGRMATQRAMIADYGRYLARCDELIAFLEDLQPPALLLWGRHDPFFHIAEVLSWMEDLPRMEAHVFDAGHLLLETHAEEAARLMAAFLERVVAPGRPANFEALQ